MHSKSLFARTYKYLISASLQKVKSVQSKDKVKCVFLGLHFCKWVHFHGATFPPGKVRVVFKKGLHLLEVVALQN